MNVKPVEKLSGEESLEGKERLQQEQRLLEEVQDYTEAPWPRVTDDMVGTVTMSGIVVTEGNYPAETSWGSSTISMSGLISYGPWATEAQIGPYTIGIDRTSNDNSAGGKTLDHLVSRVEKLEAIVEAQREILDYFLKRRNFQRGVRG